MKIVWSKIGSAISIAMAAALVPACGAGDIGEHDVEQGDAIEEQDSYSEDDAEYSEEDSDIGTLGQGLQNCSNPDGTNSVMAAFAVAVGQELRRWQAGTDFVVYNTSAAYENAPGMQQAIKLQSGTGPDGKPRGKSRCSDGQCSGVQALLALQYENARNQVFVQAEKSTNVTLVDPAALRSRMVAKLREQQNCDVNARDNSASQCPRELHALSYAGTVTLGGCGPHFKFNATKDPSGTLLYPGQLKYKLTFADQSNGWIDFRNLGNGQVAIDPTYGLNEGASTVAGSCESACTKISRSSVAGRCCSCGGATKKFVASTFSSSVFLCK